MKKYFALFLVGIFSFFTVVSAQTIKQSEVIIPKINKWAFIPRMDQCIEGMGGEHLVYNTNYNYSDTKKSTTDCLFSLAKDDFSCHKTLLTHGPDYVFIHAFETSDGAVAIYRYMDKDSKSYRICTNAISKDRDTDNWKPEVILNIPYEKKDNLAIAYAESPDKKQRVMAFFQSQRKGSAKGNLVMAFDEDGKIMWENNIDINNFNQEYFQILDVAVNNEGTAFVGIYAYDMPNNNSRSNNAVVMFEVSDNEVNNIFQEIDCNISNGKMTVGRTGNVYLGGYYYTDLKQNENGSYIYTFNPSSSSFQAFAQQDFPEDYYEKATGGLLTGVFANQKYSAVPKALYEFDNGSAVLLGELRYIVAVTSQGMTSYNYLTKNVLFSKTDDRGRFEKFDFFARAAISGGYILGDCFDDFHISYNPFFKNNRIYITYLDNIENYIDQKGTAYRLFKTGCTTLMTIDEKGEGNIQRLMSFKEDKSLIPQTLFVDNDGLYVLTRGKKSMSIAKMAIEF